MRIFNPKSANNLQSAESSPPIPPPAFLGKVKRLLKNFIGNTPWFLPAAILWATTWMALDFLIRFHQKNGVYLSATQTAQVLLANIHWIFSLTLLIGLAYGLAISTAVKDLSDPTVRRRHARIWLGLALLASPIYLLYVNFVLPEANHQAYRLKQTLIQEGDTTRIRSRLSDRELSIGQMRDSLRVIPVQVRKISESGLSPERKAKYLASRKRWEAGLRWEIAKKVQLAMLFPITAALALAAGIYLQRSRRASVRFLLAGVMAKSFIVFLMWGMGRIEKAVDVSGYSIGVTWTPIAGMALGALACAYVILKMRASSNEKAPVRETGA